jgi:hypothetical protein
MTPRKQTRPGKTKYMVLTADVTKTCATQLHLQKCPQQANPDRGRPVAAGGWDMKVPANVWGFFRGAKKVLKLHGGVSQLGEYTKPTELFMLSGEFYSMHTSSLF